MVDCSYPNPSCHANLKSKRKIKILHVTKLTPASRPPEQAQVAHQPQVFPANYAGHIHRSRLFPSTVTGFQKPTKQIVRVYISLLGQSLVSSIYSYIQLKFPKPIAYPNHPTALFTRIYTSCC